MASIVLGNQSSFDGRTLEILQNSCSLPCIIIKATSHSTSFDVPMRLVREDERHRRRFTC